MCEPETGNGKRPDRNDQVALPDANPPDQPAKDNQPGHHNQTGQRQSKIRGQFQRRAMRAIPNAPNRYTQSPVGRKAPLKSPQPCSEPRMISDHPERRAINLSATLT